MKVNIDTQFNDGKCIYCGDRAVVKAGKRKSLKGTSRQLYRCNACCRRFSSTEKHGKHTPGKAILRALVLVCRGCSYPEVQLALKREFGIVRATSTISRWCKEHALPYLDISKSLASTQGPLVRSFLFTHNGLNYNYQLHTGKLTFAARYPGLIQYLSSLPKWLDHDIFLRANHCSQLSCVANPGLKHYTDTQLNRLTAAAVPLAPSNRGRHDTVEQYLLDGDRNTIAVEVPVYFRHPTLGLVAGHIDIMQMTPNGIMLLDYKPNAAKENPAKVVSQLSLYAEALHRRANVPQQDIRCAYFDEHDVYYFDPVDIVQAAQADQNTFQTYPARRAS